MVEKVRMERRKRRMVEMSKRRIDLDRSEKMDGIGIYMQGLSDQVRGKGGLCIYIVKGLGTFFEKTPSNPVRRKRIELNWN